MIYGREEMFDLFYEIDKRYLVAYDIVGQWMWVTTNARFVMDCFYWIANAKKSFLLIELPYIDRTG